MSEPQPLRHQFEREIEELQQRLLDLARAVESALGQATKALLTQNEEMAEHVIVGEDSVNTATYEIEDYVYMLVAREQPVATDLRFIMTSLHVVIALERIGDLAVHVARSAQKLASETYIKPLISMNLMADRAKQMVRESVHAFVSRDDQSAQDVAAGDDLIDNTYSQMFRELLTYMMESPKTIAQAQTLLFVAKQYERVGDQATNICEAAAYVATGQRVELN
jgi:phosphate transport system protein